MSSFEQETVLDVHHWNDTLFSFRTTRDRSMRFRSGHFVMIGLEVEGKPLMRAYSVASAAYAEHLEFLSIKLKDGRLTSRLKNLRAGDTILVNRKAVGTLVIDDLRPGRHLYLLATGTGLAPFMSIIRDPDTYERFEKIVLIHSVRTADELAYRDAIGRELPEHELIGDAVRSQLIYHPTVTRGGDPKGERINELLQQPQFFERIGLPRLGPEHDRLMLCGSTPFLNDTCALLDALGFDVSPRQGEQGSYVVERAFVER